LGRSVAGFAEPYLNPLQWRRRVLNSYIRPIWLRFHTNSSSSSQAGVKNFTQYRMEAANLSANPTSFRDPCRHRAEISPDFKRLLDFSRFRLQLLLRWGAD
jgi:hypothetical protein